MRQIINLSAFDKHGANNRTGTSLNGKKTYHNKISHYLKPFN